MWIDTQAVVDSHGWICPVCREDLAPNVASCYRCRRVIMRFPPTKDRLATVSIWLRSPLERNHE